MRLHFAKSTRLSQLHDEILAACPAVRPVEGQAQMAVEGDSDNVWLTLPDDLSAATRQEIEAIVSNHTPAPTPQSQTQPDWVRFRAQIVTQAAYFRLVAGHPQNGVMNTLLVQLLFNVGGDPGVLPEVAQIWNTMQSNVPLTTIEIVQLNAIATVCDIPLKLDNQGRMSLG